MEGPRGSLGAVAALGLLAIGMFGWDGVWFYATTVMVRAIHGSVIDPYNPGVGVDDCPPAADTVAGSGTESSPGVGGSGRFLLS
jgi:hypothetical protein